MKHDTETTGKSGRRVKDRRRTEPAAPAAANFSSPAMKRALLVAAVIGFAFFAYSNSFNAPFLLDNDPIIIKGCADQGSHGRAHPSHFSRGVLADGPLGPVSSGHDALLPA